MSPSAADGAFHVMSCPPSSGWTADVTPAAAPGDLGLGDRTIHRGGAAAPAEPEPAPAADPAPDRRRLVVAVAGGLVILAAIVLLLVRAGGEGGGGSTTTTVPGTEPIVLGKGLSRPEQVRVTAVDGGGQRITWRAPSAADGDTYQVLFTDGPSEVRGEASIVEERALDVDTDERVCVVVQAIRDGRVSEDSTEVCSR